MGLMRPQTDLQFRPCLPRRDEGSAAANQIPQHRRQHSASSTHPEASQLVQKTQPFSHIPCTKTNNGNKNSLVGREIAILVML